jgi:hypothetical protein
MRKATEYALQCTWTYVVGDELLYREEIVRPSGRMIYYFDAIDAETTPMQV